MESSYSFEHSPDMARTLNRAAREEMKLRLLTNVRADLAVCELEGFDKSEYINQLIGLLESLKGEK